jgi:hypothetical protein
MYYKTLKINYMIIRKKIHEMKISSN